MPGTLKIKSCVLKTKIKLFKDRHHILSTFNTLQSVYEPLCQEERDKRKTLGKIVDESLA